VGQKGSALQALHDIVTSKKHRTWSKTHESIMMKHLDLVVEMKKRNYAKEALMQYRNMCQAVNINSLEEVIKYFLKKTSDKAEDAQNKAAVREDGRVGCCTKKFPFLSSQLRQQLHTKAAEKSRRFVVGIFDTGCSDGADLHPDIPAGCRQHHLTPALSSPLPLPSRTGHCPGCGGPGAGCLA
jgi:translation initiation factor 3 subunit A